jgi:hypothetical protein
VLLGLSYLFHKIFGKKPVNGLIYDKNKLPHENYPEIIKWEDGDSFYKEDDSSWDGKVWCNVKSIMYDGTIIIMTDTSKKSKLETIHISKFIRDWTNQNLETRRKEQK